MKSDIDNLNLELLPQKIREHINKLERVRRDFVANVSHELRTPLTVIRGYLETLLERDDKEFESYQEIFSQMHQHSIRMENIINDLLLLSRYESEEQPLEEREKIAIQDMLAIICQDTQKIAEEKHQTITLHADTNLFVDGSEDGLKSLFSNIIINAIKYTPPKGKISIKWYFDNGCAFFSVSDNGIGISAKHIPRITERFYRVEKARSRAGGGTGLGLAIVKHVLMRHQGELLIESALGKGSTFFCKFPKIRTTVIKPS